MATTEEIERARIDIQKAVDIFQAYGKYISPQQLLKLLWHLPLYIHISVIIASVSILLFAYRIGVSTPPLCSADLQRVGVKPGPLEFHADFPQTDLRPFMLALTAYLEQTKDVTVVRLTTDPLPTPSQPFRLRAQTTGEFVAFYPFLLVDNGKAIRTLDPPKKEGKDYIVAVPEANTGDRLMLLTSARLPKITNPANLRTAFLLRVEGP